MPTSLFVEQRQDSMAFYINGTLQFDSVDEKIYHEYLVIPAIALAVKRFPDIPLRVLICGGGDGLAVREVLNFPEVGHITLVDYSAEVLELGKTTFAEFNRHSLSHSKVDIQISEAFSFLHTRLAASLDSDPYHVIICDFTYPATTEESQIFSQEWFALIRQALHCQGLLATNAVSPNHTPQAFWCIYQSLLAAQLIAKPIYFALPSFAQQGYGNWGFFLATPTALTAAEFDLLQLPTACQELDLAKIFQSFRFPRAIAQLRHDLPPHSLASPQFLYYLLNPKGIGDLLDSELETVDFLAIADELTYTNSALSLDPDQLSLEAIAQQWWSQLDQSDAKLSLPVRNSQHDPRMMREWMGSLPALPIDLSKLMASIRDRTQTQIEKNSEPNSQLSNFKTYMTIALVLAIANLSAPHAVFAKGSYVGSGVDSDANDLWILVGFSLIGSGFYWMYYLVRKNSNR